MAQRVTPEEGCWLQYQLKLNGLTQHTVAQESNVTAKMVSHFLRGLKGSKRVEAALCEALGYGSFEGILSNVPRGKGGAA
jgi:transcriptional regulator with XRE-family HTH domain